MKLTVVVPAYNEEQVIEKVLRDLKKEIKTLGKVEIVVIDDGSTDKTAIKAKKESVKVLSHAINRGLGGALGTGLEYAKRKNSDIVVTFDADGQHDPKDIKNIIQPIIKNQADVVIGSRLLKGSKQIQIDRRLIIWGSNIITLIMFGIKTSDSQSGFRAFSKKAINNLQIKTQGMEVSSEFFSEVKRLKIRLKEVPIKVIYTDYSIQKGQTNVNAIKVLLRLFLRLAR